MQANDTREWIFDAAQTDALLMTIGATQQLAIIAVFATCANSNTGDVSVRMGLTTAATLPTITNNGLTGSDGVFFSHGGIARGGGAVATNGGEAVALGDIDQDLRMTCSAATGGSLRIVLTYQIRETA